MNLDLDPTSNLWLVALAGLSIGSVSCLAVQGGLLATAVAQRAKRLAEQGRSGDGDLAGPSASMATSSSAALPPPGARARVLPVLQFQLAKLVAYTALGAVLGAFGAQMPSRLQGAMLLLAAAFMVVVALQQLGVHPALRRVAYQPPKVAQRAIRSASRRGDALGPWLLGAATVLIPCGVTLAMEGLAVASQSAARGAAIMGVFTLGTSPLFLALGLVASGLGARAYRVFRPLAAAALVAVAGLSAVSGLRLMGVVGVAAQAPAVEAELVGAGGQPAVQQVALRAHGSGYAPDAVRIRAGVPTRLALAADPSAGCTRAFTIPRLGIEATLPSGGEVALDLPPLEPGTVPFVCGMGMFGGVIEVVP